MFHGLMNNPVYRTINKDKKGKGSRRGRQSRRKEEDEIKHAK